MAKFDPIEKIDRVETLWSWFERFGVIKAIVIAAVGGSAFTFALSWLQHLPRWIFPVLIFVASSLTVFLLFMLTVWVYMKAEEKIKKIVSEEPLSKRVTALENAIGPRHLSIDERKILLETLSKEPGKIRISVICPDDDGESYSKEISELLEECGWDVWGPDPLSESNYRMIRMTIGLNLFAAIDSIDVYQGAQRLANALAEANILCGYYRSFELHEGSCELIVGHRGTPSAY